MNSPSFDRRLSVIYGPVLFASAASISRIASWSMVILYSETPLRIRPLMFTYCALIEIWFACRFGSPDFTESLATMSSTREGAKPSETKAPFTWE
ncbi:hypothetical protein CHKEEEPN_1506 [Methylorubrum podarium]|nr:hypothetical protein CHKEEEPN_1506 [Methylorubrum podarium]